MNRPFFTVVMPAYGVEKYLEKAVKSIVAQTFSDWELLIVEDGSPDKTGEIAEKLAKNDERIQVFHHEKNRGLSPARNTGMSHAKGQYIWFMDPDDYVEATVLEEMYKALQENPAELTIIGHKEEYYDRDGKLNYTHEIRPRRQFFSSQQKMREHIIYLEQETIYGYAWNKFYSLEHIQKERLQYETVRLIEDIVFNIQFCMHIQAMNILDIAPYHYAKRMEGSLTTKFVPDYYPLHRRRIAMLYDQQRFWQTDTEETCAILGSLYGRYILSALERNCDRRAGMKHKDRAQFCREVFSDSLFESLVLRAKARDSKALKIALVCMKQKSVFLCTALARIVHIVRSGLPTVYSKVKSNR